MEYSSGVILYRLDEDGEVRFFVCTPGGPFWKNRYLWSFPKGHIENNETPFDTAIREFKEETSIEISPLETKYIYIGEIKQNSKKYVHIFVKPYDGEQLDNCFSNECTSEYPYKSGIFITHKEIKDYRWMTAKQLSKLGMVCYSSIFQDIEQKVKNG